MSSRYYCVKIEVENIEDVDVVKNTALMYDAYVDGMFDELAIEDTAENVKKRYITSLSENEKIKLAKLVESHKNSDDVISVIINQNTITLNLCVDDTFYWAADMWFEFLVLMAELTTDINFKIHFEVNVENIFFNSFGGGEHKNGIILFCGTTFWGGCEIELHGTQYFCNEYDSPENFPTFYEAGAIIDGKYVQFEKYDIPSIKDCKICFSATGYEEILTKIINQNDGIVRSCVSGKTDYLICDAEDGYETSKLIKAKEFNQTGKNIKIVTACEFFETLCFPNKSHGKKTVDDSKKKNTIGDIEKTKKKLSDVFEWKKIRNGYAITGYKGNDNDVTIPETIDGIPVTSIYYEVFWLNKNLTSIIIPNSVTEIEHHTFRGCENLKEIILPNKITEIQDSTFWDCIRLESINLPKKVKIIGRGAFRGCKSLKEINLKGVTTILDSAFSGCISLTNITIPDRDCDTIGLNQ